MSKDLAPCPSCHQPVPDDSERCPHCNTAWTISAGGSNVLSFSSSKPGDSTKPEALYQSLRTSTENRYTVVDQLGRGGMGTIYRAQDKVLKREVAMKVMRDADDGGTSLLNDPEKIARFISECQAQSQLQHPTIVPIYDIGIDHEGRVFFTMKAVKGKQLKEHILELRDGHPEPGITRFRLIQILEQVCRAVAYCHRNKVLHRDIKPQNIMVGEWGEVMLLDFGLAKVGGGAVQTVRSEAGEKTLESTFRGTPSYLAPEQVLDPENMDETTDQFHLGACLYEILTFRPPYVGQLSQCVTKAIAAEFTRPSEIDPSVPSFLEEVCLTAMARESHRRFKSVREMADKLQTYLDRETDMERRSVAAAEALTEAQAKLRRYTDFEREAANLLGQVQEARAALPRNAPAEKRAHVSRLEERRHRMLDECDRAFTDVIRAFVRAIDVAPDNRIAKQQLADLAYRKFLEMERARRKGEAGYFRALVESYHEGKYTRELQGDGSLVMTSDPPGAYVYLATYVEHGNRLTPENERYIGSTPTDKLTLPMGSYLATIRKDGYPDALYPFVIGRCEDLVTEVSLLPTSALLPGFVYVPAGRFLRGGDPVRADQRVEQLDLPAFCISEQPVTAMEYLEFINAIAAKEGWERALVRSPRATGTDGFYFRRDGTTFSLPEKDQDGDEWLPRQPVTAISYEDAEAYASWRAEKEGRPIRLPSSDEWEKAARGADGRLYPWGNGWEDGLSNSQGEESPRVPLPVDRHPSDRSPYGVLGVAGNSSDWTQTPREGKQHLRALRGGSYEFGELLIQLPIVTWLVAIRVNPGLGFRLAYTPTTGAP